MGDMPRLNALCFIMGYLVAMEIRVTLFLLVHICMNHNIGPINVCMDFEINRYKIEEFRKVQKLWLKEFHVFGDLDLDL